MWHDRGVIVLARIVLRLFANLAGLVVLSLRSRRFIEAENLFLRRQLALYRERGVKPRRGINSSLNSAVVRSVPKSFANVSARCGS